MAYDEQYGFSSYDPQSGLSPEELLFRLKNLQTRISSTISEVRREDGMS